MGGRHELALALALHWPPLERWLTADDRLIATAVRMLEEHLTREE